MKFDFSLFVKTALPVMVDCGYSRNEMREVLDVFERFFDAYAEKRGEDHPPVKAVQIERMVRMFYSTRDKHGRELDICAEDYPDMIARYYETSFGEKCDYRINHFFSDGVRSILVYQCFY